MKKDDEQLFDEYLDKSTEMSLKYKYKNMIVKGKLNVSLDSAKKLIGPDCAYHLYFKKK